MKVINGTVLIGNSNTATWLIMDELISVRFNSTHLWGPLGETDTVYSDWEDYRSSWHWMPPQLF